MTRVHLLHNISLVIYTPYLVIALLHHRRSQTTTLETVHRPSSFEVRVYRRHRCVFPTESVLSIGNTRGELERRRLNEARRTSHPSLRAFRSAENFCRVGAQVAVFHLIPSAATSSRRCYSHLVSYLLLQLAFSSFLHHHPSAYHVFRPRDRLGMPSRANSQNNQTYGSPLCLPSYYFLEIL